MIWWLASLALLCACSTGQEVRGAAPEAGRDAGQDVSADGAPEDAERADESVDLAMADLGADLPRDLGNPDLDAADIRADTDPDGLDGEQDTDATRDSGADSETGLEHGPETVITAQGPVVGRLDDGILSFRGIPYAAPPVGGLRWRAPRPPTVRDGPLPALEFGAACPQPNDSWVVGQGLARDENCLTLNAWVRPDPPEPVPVMVWLHGGGFFLGSGAEPQFDGAALARDGAMVVTLNYRLGALGFLVHDALRDGEPGLGNYGLLDVIAALRWVRENAAAFGGDPARVTVFGESAGGILVCALLASPLAADAFDAAIMQSGFCTVEAATLDEGTDLQPSALQTGAVFGLHAGCEGLDVAQCLRGLTPDEVLATVDRMGDDSAAIGLVVDGHALEDTPWATMQAGRGAPVPLIAGTVADEGTVFLSQTPIPDEEAYRSFLDETFTDVVTPFILVLYPTRDFETPWHAAAAVFGDALFTCPTREAMRAHVGAGNPGWLYYFGHVTDDGRRRGLGAYHASDVPFTFGTHAANPVGDEVSDTTRALWTTFASTGRPMSDVPWPPYSTRLDPVLELDADPEIVERWRDDRCRFWAGGD